MPPDVPLSHGRIARFYVPLALSWVFMAIEGPLCLALISQVAFPELNTAALNIVMGIALFIESPVIDLLTTSTTLSKNHRDYATLSKFVCWIMLAVTAVHALIVFTPIYGFVTATLMGLPLDVADSARAALALMVPWSAAIGWRRYLQGILIRYDRTRMVGIGTFVRVSAVALSSVLLLKFSSLSGVEMAACALVTSVVAEALFAHWASRKAIREHLAVDLAGDAQATPLTMRRLVSFHAPLTLTTMVTLFGLPVVSAFLAQSQNAVLSLAAWQVAFSLVWLFRTITFALPEVVITLYDGEQSAKKLRDFCLIVGIGCTLAVVVMGIFRLDIAFFRQFYTHSDQTYELAHVAFLAAAPLAVIGAVQSYVRGMLTAHHLNVARFTAVLIAMGTLVLGLGIALRLPGQAVLLGCIVQSVALIAELAFLSWALKKKVGGNTAWPEKRTVVPA